MRAWRRYQPFYTIQIRLVSAMSHSSAVQEQILRLSTVPWLWSNEIFGFHHPDLDHFENLDPDPSVDFKPASFGSGSINRQLRPASWESKTS